jgi:hypothetical protein
LDALGRVRRAHGLKDTLLKLFKHLIISLPACLSQKILRHGFHEDREWVSVISLSLNAKHTEGPQ